jgi:hypothetical protein
MEFKANLSAFDGNDNLFSEETFNFDICFDLEGDDESDFNEDEAIEAFFTADFEL